MNLLRMPGFSLIVLMFILSMAQPAVAACREPDAETASMRPQSTRTGPQEPSAKKRGQADRLAVTGGLKRLNREGREGRKGWEVTEKRAMFLMIQC